jgi:hypothetical protein
VLTGSSGDCVLQEEDADKEKEQETYLWSTIMNGKVEKKQGGRGSLQMVREV